MIPGVLGQLPFYCSSDIVFTFRDLQREVSSRWARHDVLYKKPLLEYVGPELMTVSMKIRLDMSLGVPPILAFDRLKRMVENRQYKTLVIGGEYMGRYILESVSEERKFHGFAGVCTLGEATLNLIEWGG